MAIQAQAGTSKAASAKAQKWRRKTPIVARMCMTSFKWARCLAERANGSSVADLIAVTFSRPDGGLPTGGPPLLRRAREWRVNGGAEKSGRGLNGSSTPWCHVGACTSKGGGLAAADDPVAARDRAFRLRAGTRPAATAVFT